MRWLIARMAMSTSPPSASALDRARDRFIHPDHYDSCVIFVCDQSPRRLSISISRRIGGLLGKGAGGRQEVGIRRDGAKTGLRRSRYRRREPRLRTNGAMHSSGSISAANASIAFVSLSAATRLGRRRTFPPRSACGLMAERSSPCSTGWRCGTMVANFRTLAIIEPDLPDNRLNEGRVGPDGAFWRFLVADPATRLTQAGRRTAAPLWYRLVRTSSDSPLPPVDRG